jgi:hypothetical protein
VFIEAQSRRPCDSFSSLPPTPLVLSGVPDSSARSPRISTSIQLSLLECAVPQNAPLNPLECAVPKTGHFKPFRMRSSEKSGGGTSFQAKYFFSSSPRLASPRLASPRLARAAARHSAQVLSFHTLAHSFALNKNSTLLFSIDCTLFAKNHPGWGYLNLPLPPHWPELANRPWTCLSPFNLQLSTVNLLRTALHGSWITERGSRVRITEHGSRHGSQRRGERIAN